MLAASQCLLVMTLLLTTLMRQCIFYCKGERGRKRGTGREEGEGGRKEGKTGDGKGVKERRKEKGTKERREERRKGRKKGPNFLIYELLSSAKM